ncbi:MAG: hypothetical protein ACP6IQ_08175 [Candidatus Njordarchaeia archaeon]
MSSSKKKKKKTFTGKIIEKGIVKMVKEDFLIDNVEWNSKFSVDRGKILKSWVESGLLEVTDISPNILKKAVDKVGVAIYRKSAPKEIPLLVIFTDTIPKKSTAASVNELAKVFKKIFPKVKTMLLAIGNDPDKINPSKYSHLDFIGFGSTLDDVWEVIKDDIEDVFKENA